MISGRGEEAQAMPTASGSPGYEELSRVVRQVRNRWRLRVALRGGAIVLATAFVAFVIAAYGMDAFRYSPWAIATFRIFAYAALLGLVVRFLVLPLSVRVPDERVALYIEEHDPTLQASILSAVEMAPRVEAADPPDLSRGLVRRLVESAIEQCQRVEYGTLVERRSLHRFSAVLAATALAGMLGALLSPAFLRQAAPFLFAPWSVRAASPYVIEVEPGNAEIARGGDQTIVARLSGFDSDKVELLTKTGETGEWKRAPMAADEGGKGYRFMLLDVGARTEYLVEASGVRSAMFRLDVVDVPYVKRIDLEYLFPAYTGLPPQTVEDGGDVAALRGTEVRIRVTPTVRVASGRLQVVGEAATALSAEPDGTLSGSLTVSKEGFYRIEFPAREGGLKAGSPDYSIDVLSDQPPSVAFLKPGRDAKVTPIEEVFTELKAEDDYGVARVQLTYSVNGGPERTLDLHKGAARKFVSAGHTFFLEELELQPGDFISYFARASDAGPRPQTATTDIYFMEARPFGKEYRQAEQRGGGGGGAGGADGALSYQQRQIIAATFKMIRDRARFSEKEFGEDMAALALAQGRLLEQVESLVRRMSTRGILESGSDFQKTADFLRTAATEMGPAKDNLEKRKAKEALPPEQRALQHLQRAEAVFRDIQVSFGGGGGGGGSNLNAEDLADLFELELDKLRNQYETVERSGQEKVENQIDEAMQRLRELARRQEQENERMKQLAGRLPNQGGGGGGSQRELAEQAEELGRKLERLARERSSAALEDTARRLQEAASAMRRSSSSARGGSLADGLSALDRLKDARRLLEQNRAGRLDRDMREALRRAQELRAAQEKIASDVEQMGQAGGEGGQQRIERLLERKDALAEQVGELESQLDRMASDSRREKKEASRKLHAAADSIRDSKLKEKIRFSKGVVKSRSPEYARQFEGEIGSDIQALEGKLRDAEGSIGSSEEEKRAAALDKARQLVRNMESLDERMRDKGSRGSQKAGRLQDRGDGADQPGSPQNQGGQQDGEQQGGGQQGSGGGQDGGRSEAGGPAGRDRRGLGSNRSEGPFGPYSGGGDARPGRWSGSLSPEDVRQFRRELRERLKDAEDLRRQLSRDGRLPQDLQAIIRNMRALDEDKPFGDPRGLDQLVAAIVEDLKLFEYALRRDVEGAEKQKLFLSGSEELPEGWQRLVEEYYRALSRSSPR
jgi:hypothetical protein